MSYRKMIASKEMIEEIIAKHDALAEKEAKRILDSRTLYNVEEQDSNFSVEKLEELCRKDFQRLSKKRPIYEEKMLDLHRLILALTDDNLKLEEETRLSCLEYLLEELNVIFMDLLSFVQGEEKC